MKRELNDIRSALRRLDKSSTQLTRRNARRAFSAAVQRLRKAVDKNYPAIDKDGVARVPKKVRGVVCPECGVPMQSFRALTNHLISNHARKSGVRSTLSQTAFVPIQNKPAIFDVNAEFAPYDCLCGKRCKGVVGLTRHLSSQESVAEHIAMAKLFGDLQMAKKIERAKKKAEQKAYLDSL